MIDDTNKSDDFNETEFDSPPPAFFDRAATANAQPVEPIPRRRIDVWIQRARNTRHLLNVRRKALALVLVGGLVFGVLGGTLLVKQASSSSAPPIEQQPIAESTAASDSVPDPVSNAETVALDAAAGALQHADRPSSGNRRDRVHGRVPIPRAYRVAVIK
ncbi:MAG TPA: hypothetical protein VIF64_01945 [Pyrinomonadaceae bacterium]|jgi:hypothetical protein